MNKWIGWVIIGLVVVLAVIAFVRWIGLPVPCLSPTQGGGCTAGLPLNTVVYFVLTPITLLFLIPQFAISRMPYAKYIALLLALVAYAFSQNWIQGLTAFPLPNPTVPL